MRIFGYVGLLLLLVGLSGTTAAQQKESHLHMDHVLKSWRDTPEQKGLLPTAQAEAAIALEHMGFALSQPNDLANVKLHMTHVIHALDPEVITLGPGLGYGVKRAANGVVSHIRFSAGAGDASENVRLHAVHVSTSANNVVLWVNEAIRLAQGVADESDANAAISNAGKVQILLDRIVNGVDANNDGTVNWQEGEGGLAQAGQHMGFMVTGEGGT